MSSLRAFRITILAAPLMILGACGDTQAEASDAAANQTGNAVFTSPAEKLAQTYDGGWISLNGRVDSAGPSMFVLDYGNGKVSVEMDDWDWYQEGAALKAGDQVVVRGRVDNDFVSMKRIEASSVYVRKLNTYFYANAADEEAVPLMSLQSTPPAGEVDATGRVRSVEGREFTMGSASGPLRVDTSAMADNPLDKEGFLQVKPGDRVYIWGSWNAEMAENPEIKATGIVRFAQDQTKAKSASASTSKSNAKAP